jgi:hypothetical protein
VLKLSHFFQVNYEIFRFVFSLFIMVEVFVFEIEENQFGIFHFYQSEEDSFEGESLAALIFGKCRQ